MPRSKPTLEAICSAENFHEIYERLAPQFGYETRTETRKFNPDSPNGKLMIAVSAAICAAIRKAKCMREHIYCGYTPSAYDKVEECLCEGRHYPDKCIHCGQPAPTETAKGGEDEC